MTTLAELRDRARQRADMENSNFISDAELNDYISESYAELYDLLVSRFEDYFIVDPLAFTISSGSTYTLPSDFYKLVGLDKKSNGTNYYTIRPFNFMNRNRNSSTSRLLGRYPDVAYRIMGGDLRITPDSKAAGDYQLWYVPSFTPLADDDDVVDTTITRNNWERYIVIDAAIKMLSKEESDTSHLEREKMILEKKIEEMAQNRDIGDTDRITDVNNDYEDDFYYR